MQHQVPGNVSSSSVIAFPLYFLSPSTEKSVVLGEFLPPVSAGPIIQYRACFLALEHPSRISPRESAAA